MISILFTSAEAAFIVGVVPAALARDEPILFERGESLRIGLTVFYNHVVLSGPPALYMYEDGAPDMQADRVGTMPGPPADDPYGSMIAVLLADEEARRRVTAALALQASTAEPKSSSSGDALDEDSEAQIAAERVKQNWAVAVIQSAFMRKRLGNDLALLIAELGLDAMHAGLELEAGSRAVFVASFSNKLFKPPGGFGQLFE